MSNRPAWQVINDITRSLTRLREDQRGGVAVMMGLLFPVVLATLGLGFEISNWYLKTRSMQNAADAAAIAAASCWYNTLAPPSYAINAAMPSAIRKRPAVSALVG